MEKRMKDQTIPASPLHPFRVVREPFECVTVDCVGLFSETMTGHPFLLMIICAATYFLEAVPLRRFSAPLITKALKFFTTFRLPRVVQTDEYTNFTSKLFKLVMKSLGIEQFSFLVLFI